MEEVTLSIALVAGLLSFLSPCVLPLVPAYVSYMGGRAVHQVASDGDSATKRKRSLRSRLAIVTHGLAFVAGFTFVFVTLGIATTAFVQYVGASAAVITEIIARLGGIIIIFFGLHFMGALREFFMWLRKHPKYLTNFPTLLILVGVVAVATLWFSAQAVLTWTIGTLLIRMAILVISLIVLAYLYTKGPLGSVGSAVYEQREALGALPTTIVFAILGIVIIIWSFVELVIAIPVAAIFFILLFLGKAFDKPEEFWLGIITKIETALYTDTRRDIDATGSSSLSGSFIMGVTFSAGWTPCIGPIYGAILQLGLQGDVFAAVPLLFMYSLGLGIPFMITAGLLDGAQVILRRIQRYMGQIELFTGFLLIFVGLLVASGQLQSLSQNLSPEQTEFSINIEECGTSVAQGHISFSEFGACMNNTLKPISIGQGVADEFVSDKSEVTYVFHIDEATVIDVDLSRIEADFPVIITVQDAEGNELASSDVITPVNERTFRILENVELNTAGRYSIIATRSDENTEELDFRLTVRRDEGDVEATSDSTLEISTVSSIEAIASDDVAVGLDIDNRAPNFEAVTIAGEDVSLESLRGQIVLVNFWGTWCGPCIREMPDLQEVYEQYADSFTILALATGGDTQEDVIEFREEYELTFPLIVDEGDVINDQYGIVNRPSTFILDQDGVIVFRHFGPVVESQLMEVLESLMES